MRDPSEVIAACPFCGAPGEIMETTATTPHVIACCSGDCELMPSTHPQLRQSAIAAWNRRAAPQPASAEVDRYNPDELLRAARWMIGGLLAGAKANDGDMILVERIDQHLAAIKGDSHAG